MFCIVCYFVSFIVLHIVLFGLTTTKLNKLYYYYIEVFRPIGATRCTNGGEIWRGGVDQKLKILLKFY